MPKTIRWPKPYTKALTRDQIRLVLRIYLVDKRSRARQGFYRCTNGLIARLAAEFGVKEKLIREITETARPRRRKRRKFRDIDITLERYYAEFRDNGRARYRNALAGNRTKQDPAGSG